MFYPVLFFLIAAIVILYIGWEMGYSYCVQKYDLREYEEEEIARYEDSWEFPAPVLRPDAVVMEDGEVFVPKYR